MLFGGEGWDDLVGNSGQDELHGGPGYDVLIGGGDADMLFGDGGNDDLYGQRGNDTLDGGDGDDFCRGGSGNDTLVNCEGASASNVDGDDLNLNDEKQVLRSNDGPAGEHAVEQRIKELFLPLITNE